MESLDRRGPDRGRARHDDDRAGRRAGAAACSRPARPPDRGGAARRAAGRLGRRARHGELPRPPRRCRRSSQGRKFYRHNPNVTLMRTTPEENRRLGAEIGRKVARGDRGPPRSCCRCGASRRSTRAGQPFDDPAARQALFAAIREHAAGRRGHRAGPPHQRSRVRRGARPGSCWTLIRWVSIERECGARSDDNSRHGILKRFREKIARGEPIIGGGAGHGHLGQERGGRRHRPHDHLQLGPLPDGRPRLDRRA